MFMNAPPRLGYHGLDVFAFEQDMKARAQQRFNDRRQKKFFVRNGKFPLSHHGRPTQQPGVMASEDWSLASVPDGIQDSFEAQQLRNRYLAGTAGSPYADHDHGIFYQRAQRLDGSLGNKRPVVDHTHLWQPPFGVHDVNDIQSMFAPMQYQFDIAPMDGLHMPLSNGMGQGMPTSSPEFASSDAGTSFGSFSSCSFAPADGSAIITSPSDQFDYAHSSYTNSSMVHEDLHNNIKRAPPSPPAFSEPAPLHFFATSQEQLVEGQCHMDGHEEAVRAAMLENHGGCSGIKADPATRHMLSSRPRRELPDQSRSSRTGPGSSSRRRGSPSRKQSVSAAAAHKSEPRPTQSKQSKPCPAQASPMDPTERSAKDEYLLKAKQEGLTYREIRVKGNFTEAESTLRGRYRTLTKNKEARVRKPEWTDKDVHLLQRAVRKFAKGNDPASTKIPWKQVAEYIQRNGGSYLFGNATCRKKWDELVLAALEGQM
ncbi:hypothetical protein CH063_06367 [Colletotrichum higginsianum]|uniref:Myb-like domain-containing protein n=2 Tax=Colletotrichum higginsianum TaxID=80884 RepID=H1V297_COLHI|nr:hypothetical protein CH63R_03461 [Colletotrichum higginsianum IMI 349063]OBR14735.1 hypothetical protein CH63R_03461 [Colletotrichum higginsianum IMI 349063]TID01838.1 hypothetical protein CH35J_004820 [Colletotrichum higginsianum]CCF34349.1 hypothetical protein CH063_06367 [Colletotrichum higginsianum]